MSVIMILEIDRNASPAEIQRALALCNVSRLTGRDMGFTGNFPSSNMYFSCEYYDADDEMVKAEEAAVSWNVGSRLTFVYVTSRLDECSTQLHNFLLTMSDVTSSNWVLSFQYESMCGVRDSTGIHWLKDF